MKKKYLLCLLMVFFSFILIDQSIVTTYAATGFSSETYTPVIAENNTVSNYLNLENITYFTVFNNTVFYTTDKTTVQAYNLETKSLDTLDHIFTNIDYMYSALGYLFISDNHSLLVFKNNVQLLGAFPYSTPSGYTCISFYETGDDLFVSFIKDNNLYFNHYRDSNTHNMLMLLDDKTYLGASYNNIFDSVSLITNSTNHVYIVSTTGFTMVNVTENLATYRTQPGNDDNAFNTLNSKQIAYIKYNELDLLVTLTSERLKVYDATNELYFGQDIGYRNLGVDSYITGQLCNPQFLDINSDKIYISDNYTTCKNIQAFVIDNSGIKVHSTLVASISHDLGRFYNAEDILYKDASTMYVADTKNNRVQIFNGTSVTVLDDLHTTYTNTNPKNLLLDEYNNLYFTIHTDTDKTSILKYDGVNTTTVREFNGVIADTTITPDNTIYALDSTLNKVVKINKTSAEAICDTIGDIKDTAKIEYITYIDALLIYNNNTFTVLDNEGNIKATRPATSINDYTVDYKGNVYIMTDSALYSLKIKFDYTFDTTPTPCAFAGNFSGYSVITLNPTTTTLYLFNHNRQCIESFASDTIESISVECPVDAFNNEALTSVTQVKPAKITLASLIYEYPYNLGNVYNKNYEVENVIVIGEYQEYYYTLFNNNNSLQAGYIKKDRVTIQNISYENKEVITTSHKVDVYKYPTLLKNNGSIYVIDSMPIHEKITTIATFPISIDGMKFYMYNFDGNVGFLYAADVIIGTSHIDYLPVSNATIHIIDKTDAVNVYKEEDSSSQIVASLLEGTRITIDLDEFDSTKEYTKITYVDDNQVTHTGYIKTANIKLDGIDSNTIMLFIIIGVTIVIFIALVITFHQIKKKRKLYN